MSDKKTALTRRNFLKDSVGRAGTAAVVWQGLASAGFSTTARSAARIQGANDRIRLAAIGTGGRTRGLMNQLKKLPGNSHVAICDVYEPNLLQAAGVAGPEVKQYKDYRALLDSKEVDAVVIGSPDHWHRQMTIDAVGAGKDVYVEKPISHSIEEGAEMVRTVESSKRVVQTGTQQRSWKHFVDGKQLVEAGKLGQITLVRAYWYQNYAARLLSPGDFSPDKLDARAWLGPAPKQAVTSEKYHRWRWYWDFGGGALTDLMTHWIDVVQWYMGTPAPLTAVAHGNLYAMRWECPDTITCYLEYPKNYSVVYDGTMTSKIDDGGIEFRGTRGTIKINRSRLAFYSEDSKNPVEPEMVIRSEEDGTIAHLRNFLDCVRSRQAPTADIRVAHEAARAAHLGNISLRKQRKVRWNAAADRVES